MKLSDLEGRKVVIWGAAREAQALLRTLQRLGIGLSVALYDEAGTQEDQVIENVRVLTGELGRTALAQAEVIVLSPGVSMYRPEVEEQKARGALLTTATDLWFGEGYQNVIAVTGTKGKSTTASLIAHLLNATGHSAQLAGNIGRAPIDFVGETNADWWVLELSSFQSAGVRNSPSIGVLTTISPEHLDWHGSFDRYRADKLNLFAHNPNIVTIANVEDGGVREILDRLPNVIEAGADPIVHPDGVVVIDGSFNYRGKSLFPITPLRLLGRHNLRLACLALTTVAQAGVDLVAQSAVLSGALFSFEPLPHRLSPVGTYGDVTYVDDGLATTPIATMAAIDAFEDRAVTLLAGGHDRGVSYDELGEFLVQHAGLVRVITMPANGERIADSIEKADQQSKVEIHVSDGLDDAVQIASEITPAGGVVLLSPAAASFGAFRDYVARSDAFVHAITSLYDSPTN